MRSAPELSASARSSYKHRACQCFPVSSLGCDAFMFDRSALPIKNSGTSREGFFSDDRVSAVLASTQLEPAALMTCADARFVRYRRYYICLFYYMSFLTGLWPAKSGYRLGCI